MLLAVALEWLRTLAGKRQSMSKGAAAHLS
jgi:hypothetical protein